VLARHERSETAIQHKTFNAPDEVRRFPKGILTLVHLGSVTMGWLAQGIPRAGMSPAASGGRTVEPVPRRTSDAQRDLFDGRLI
jgi:hypothetical protein